MLTDASSTSLVAWPKRGTQSQKCITLYNRNLSFVPEDVCEVYSLRDKTTSIFFSSRPHISFKFRIPDHPVYLFAWQLRIYKSRMFRHGLPHFTTRKKKCVLFFSGSLAFVICCTLKCSYFRFEQPAPFPLGNEDGKRRRPSVHFQHQVWSDYWCPFVPFVTRSLEERRLMLKTARGDRGRKSHLAERGAPKSN